LAALLGGLPFKADEGAGPPEPPATAAAGCDCVLNLF